MNDNGYLDPQGETLRYSVDLALFNIRLAIDRLRDVRNPNDFTALRRDFDQAKEFHTMASEAYYGHRDSIERQRKELKRQRKQEVSDETTISAGS